MKKLSTHRLALRRDTVKIMVTELSKDQLRKVEGGATRTGDSSGGGTSVVSTGPTFGCPSHNCTIG
jgi:hypothetical protein